MTPHISAKKEDIATIVLMPGDPIRAKYIATNYLQDVQLVNSVRNMLMFTGMYEEKRITIAGSGMGCPSIGIYSYELFKFYDVDVIIRIGSAGAYDEKLKLYDVINVSSVYGENNYAKIVGATDDDTIETNPNIYELINKTASDKNINIISGRVHCSDVFYRKNFEEYKRFLSEKQTIAVEMEAFALFANAKVLNKQVGCILTVSDSLVTKEATTSEKREQSFDKMMILALKTAVNFYKQGV
ncbi:purine-nucleoside phosphorylase [Spiroplasma endosymbiont of Agriotes lineatus]|uniref:purine-nucleoside phosphorylase n=1 Tax=Spiroplasma endosymbiont of Agriotes lineatus TaxID=3077930 RepID=UPI0030D2DCC9